MLGDILHQTRVKETAGLPAAPWHHAVRIGLVEQLCQRLTTPEPVRYTLDGWLHASSLFGLCTKQAAITFDQQIPDAQRLKILEPGLRLTFEIGKSIEWVLVHRLLGPMGLLLGQWSCARCGREKGQALDPHPMAIDHCERCGGRSWHYEQPRVVDEALKVVGHVDGILRSPQDGSLGIFESKSVDGIAFKKMTKPFERDLFQAQTYLTLSGYTWAVIVYTSKAMETVPFREFGIRADPAHAAVVRGIVEEVRSGGRRACRDAKTKRALACFCRKACFNLETPGDVSRPG